MGMSRATLGRLIEERHGMKPGEWLKASHKMADDFVRNAIFEAAVRGASDPRFAQQQIMYARMYLGYNPYSRHDININASGEIRIKAVAEIPRNGFELEEGAERPQHTMGAPMPLPAPDEDVPKDE